MPIFTIHKNITMNSTLINPIWTNFFRRFSRRRILKFDLEIRVISEYLSEIRWSQT